MLRSAMHSRSALLALTATSTSLVYSNTNFTTITFSQQSHLREPPPPSLSSSLSSYSNFTLIPILALRTTRLITTVSSIILTYKLPHLLPSSTSTSENEINNEVDTATHLLMEAQAAYTGSGSGSSTSSTSNPNPNNLTKSELRDLVDTLSEDLAIAESAASTLLTNRHSIAAKKLLNLCRMNGGCYIKVGQHLANLDYLLPSEYTTALSELYNEAPVSDITEIRDLVKRELGSFPEELFIDFNFTPIASASLAQVHSAYILDPLTKEKRRVAVKIQHPSVGDAASGDIFALMIVVNLLERFMEGFKFNWLSQEIGPQIFKELDFTNEGDNGKKCQMQLKNEFGKRVVVPDVIDQYCSKKVLCMSYEDNAFKTTDLKAIANANLSNSDVAELVSDVFCYQVFQTGFVHCDPHCSNVLIRAVDGKPQMVLVDHGLYKTLGDDFRLDYCDLWIAIVLADLEGIEKTCRKMNAENMFPLLTAMLTGRPYDEIMDKSRGSKSKRINAKKGMPSSTQADNAKIRLYAARYAAEICKLLEDMPRDLCLLLKMNDCLRHIDSVLGKPVNSFATAGRRAAMGKLLSVVRDSGRGVKEKVGEIWRFVVAGFRIGFFSRVAMLAGS